MALDSQRLARLCGEGGFFRLEKRALIRVSGADRLRYLNGQVSNDLRRLKAGSAQQALVLTAKGKLCASLWIWADGESYLIESPAGLVDEVLPRLERYAIADDVVFEQVDEEMAGWHVFGPAAETLASGLEISRIGLPGRDVAETPSGPWQEATADEVEFLRIQQGIPAWGAELDTDTLPQEARLERFAVDFHKGCYVGQEVVSRLKSVGRVNELLFGFQGSLSAATAERNYPLQNSTGKSIGHLTSVVETTPGQIAALGFASTREPETVFSVTDESGACLGRVERCEFPLILA